jgi:hypothetical protein
MTLATELVAQFARIVRSDGGQLTILQDDEAVVRLGYVAGHDAECESGACVLPHFELQTMMREWLARRAPGAKVTVQLINAADG